MARGHVGDERLVRAGAQKQKVPWCARLGVHRVPRGLQGVQQAGTVFGAQRLLHLVHDQHHIHPGFGHQFRVCLRQRGTAGRAQVFNLKAQGQAHGPQVQPLEALQQARAGGLHLLQRGAHGVQHQGGRALAAVGPQVHIHHECTARFQRGHQVLPQEGGFAHAAYARQQHARAHVHVQGRRLQQLLRHLLGIGSAVKNVGGHAYLFLSFTG